MKVVLIFRKRIHGANSIEEIFHAIARELRNYAEVIEYEVGSRTNLLKDINNLRRLKADIYHVTGDINYFINFLPRKKTILTIHDIGHYVVTLKGFKRIIYKWLWFKFSIKFATKVTTISENTKNEIVKHLNTPLDKINIIHDCYSPIFKLNLKKFSSSEPIILQVGTQIYKNVPRLIEAISGLKCKLYIIGNLTEHLTKLLKESKIDYTNFTGLTHEEVYNCYVACDLVAFISLGEGFGMPIVEAQAVGRPLITSNIPPMCDVAGKGAKLVDPKNTLEIKSGILSIIEDEAFRNNLITNGLENVKSYTLEHISKEYYTLYESMIG